MPEIILYGVTLTATVVWSAVGLALWMRNSEDVLNQLKKLALFIVSGPLVWLFVGINGIMFLLDECRSIFESWLRR
jgi:hypothetical protein